MSDCVKCQAGQGRACECRDAMSPARGMVVGVIVSLVIWAAIAAAGVLLWN